MTYQQTIDFLYTRLPMFTRVGAIAYKKDMHNTLALLQVLGNPHHSFKSIHVAGTNGKGSTSHMLAAIFHRCGYKTGLYTSPHLYDFRERIKVSEENALAIVSETFVVNFVQSILPHIDSIDPSFFEVTVAMAFAWFAEQQVDIAIIETGLGGRLDSTNVITPILSIITNIGWDHMQLLGNSLPEIAYEKAGIIKKGVPVVVGEVLPETLPVFTAKAQQSDATLYFAETAYTIGNTILKIDAFTVDFYEHDTHSWLQMQCDLPGMYQQYNIRTVLTGLDQLRTMGWHLPMSLVANALANVKGLTGLWGRWQLIAQSPYVVLDVAHNQSGIQQLVQQVKYMQAQGMVQQVHLIIGMVKDKDVQNVLTLLHKHYHYYFTQAQLPRALPYQTLQQIAWDTCQLEGGAFATPDMALQAAKLKASPEDLIIVCGSVFVVAEISWDK